jgi:glucosyl-3-phosphoglycerate synthase
MSAPIGTAREGNAREPLSGSDFDLERVLRTKRDRTVSVVLPARNEAATIGAIVSVLSSRLVASGVVDQLVVMDDGSSDETASIASAAGADVVRTDSVAADLGVGFGKGEALWKSLLVTEGDIICWCDADVVDFDGSYVLGLVGALLSDDDAVFAKACYDRPIEHAGGSSTNLTGGRVTELVARPLIALLFPVLADIIQPLSGEFAATRRAIESVPFGRGYAVDLALLIDVSREFGRDRIVQVDVGSRKHRHQPLLDLGVQATAITSMALRKAGVAQPATQAVLRQPQDVERTIQLGELPSLNSYRRRQRRNPARPA